MHRVVDRVLHCYGAINGALLPPLPRLVDEGDAAPVAQAHKREQRRGDDDDAAEGAADERPGGALGLVCERVIPRLHAAQGVLRSDASASASALACVQHEASWLCCIPCRLNTPVGSRGMPRPPSSKHHTVLKYRRVLCCMSREASSSKLKPQNRATKQLEQAAHTCWMSRNAASSKLSSSARSSAGNKPSGSVPSGTGWLRSNSVLLMLSRSGDEYTLPMSESLDVSVPTLPAKSLPRKTAFTGLFPGVVSMTTPRKSGAPPASLSLSANVQLAKSALVVSPLGALCTQPAGPPFQRKPTNVHSACACVFHSGDTASQSA